VWKKGFFAFEYKKRKKNLKEAQDQLARYAWHLENPPIHVACDTNLIRVITAFNNAPTRSFDIALDDLAKLESRAILEALFHDPERLRGHMTREMLTRGRRRLLGDFRAPAAAPPGPRGGRAFSSTSSSSASSPRT
jgi:hypothetical protein